MHCVHLFIKINTSLCSQRPLPAKYRPFRDRVFTNIKQPVFHQPPAILGTSAARPSHYRLTWSEKSMKCALDAVLYEGMSVSKAAQAYGIPKSTLYDHRIGKTLPGVKSGPPTLLTEEEETELVSFLVESADIGYPKSRLDVIAMAQHIIAKKGIEHQITNGWWQAFHRRHHSILSLKTATSLSVARAKASCPESLKKWYSILEETMTKYSLSEDPALVFNMDETGFPLDPKPPKSVFSRGEKNPCYVSAGNKSQITVIGCVSAAGQCLPPLIIWPRKTMAPELAIGEIPGSVYGLIERGWATRELFEQWFKKHFLRYAPAARPLLLLLDGHSSHYSLETMKMAMKDDVIILALPPNTTHLTQPLDKGTFGPLKTRWRQVVHDFRVSHPGRVVTQYNFCRLFSKAWVEAMTAVNISAGFQTTGIYPLNADALKLPCQTKSNSDIIHSTAAFTPAKRDVLDLEKEKRDVCDSGEEDISLPNPDDAALESPLISVSDYRPAKQRTMLQMLDINTVPQRQASTKPKKDEDPSLLLLTSSENVARMEAKKDKNKNKGKGKKQRSKAVAKRTREFVFCKFCVSNCHCTMYVHVHVHFHTGFSDGTLPGSQSDEESHLGAHGECMNIVDATNFYPYMYM